MREQDNVPFATITISHGAHNPCNFSFPLEISAGLDGPHGCYFSPTVLALSLLLYIHYRGTSNRSRKMEGGPEVITVKETREERAGGTVWLQPPPPQLAINSGYCWSTLPGRR